MKNTTMKAEILDDPGKSMSLGSVAQLGSSRCFTKVVSEAKQKQQKVIKITTITLELLKTDTNIVIPNLSNGRASCGFILEAFTYYTSALFKCSIFVSNLIICQFGISCLLFVLAIPQNSVKEVLRAPGTIKDRIKKLLAHKNSMKKKVKIKNVTPEPTSTPTPKVNLQPFNYEDSVSRGGNSHGDKKGNEEKMKEGLEEEKREEKALKNDIEEQSLRGDVFCECYFYFICFMNNELQFILANERRQKAGFTA